MNIHHDIGRSARLAAGLLILCLAPLSAGDLTGRITAGDFPAGGSALPPVVWIEGAPAAPVPGIDLEITHRDGKIVPAIGLAYVGRQFIFRNDDPVFHNTHLYLHLDYHRRTSQRPLYYGATLYNVPLPLNGTAVRKPVKAYHRVRAETGFVEVVCNPHPEEKAYVLVFDHPYCAIAGPDGSYAIHDIPPGRYPVWAFHGGEMQKITDAAIRPEGATRLDLEMP